MSVHWLMAACYLILFTTGTLMAQLPRELPGRNPLYDFHKSIGTLTIALLSWRILVLLQVWRHKYTRRLPRFSWAWMQKVALHSLLYGFMWGVPVTGFFLSNSFKNQNVRFFGLVLPDLFPQNPALVDLGRNLHFWLAYTFCAFVVLHILVQRKVVWANWRRLSGFVKSKMTRS